MSEAYWNGLFDTRWEDAPLGREAIRLAQWLRQRGHAEGARREFAHAVVHLGRVVHETQGGVDAMSLDETVVEEFIRRHLPACCCYRRQPGRQSVHVRRGLAHLLAMLREEGTIPPPRSVEPVYHELLEGYCRFLRNDRGLAETTIINYRRYVRDFLIGRGDAVSPSELASEAGPWAGCRSRPRGLGRGRGAQMRRRLDGLAAQMRRRLDGLAATAGVQYGKASPGNRSAHPASSTRPCLRRYWKDHRTSGIEWASS